MPPLGPKERPILVVLFAVAVVEVLHAIGTNAGYHFVHEALAGRVDDAHRRVLVHQFATDRVQEFTSKIEETACVRARL
jgi:hypothetical protein